MAPRVRNAKPTRITADLSSEDYQTLQELRESTGSMSKVDVVRAALRLLAHLHERSREGYTICVTRGGESTTITYPFFPATPDAPSDRGDHRVAHVPGQGIVVYGGQPGPKEEERCRHCPHTKHKGQCSAETYNGYSCRCIE